MNRTHYNRAPNTPGRNIRFFDIPFTHAYKRSYSPLSIKNTSTPRDSWLSPVNLHDVRIYEQPSVIWMLKYMFSNKCMNFFKIPSINYRQNRLSTNRLSFLPLWHKKEFQNESCFSQKSSCGKCNMPGMNKTVIDSEPESGYK